MGQERMLLRSALWNACIPSVVFAAEIPTYLVFNNLKNIFGYYETEAERRLEQTAVACYTTYD